ncbi:MAG: hypothetical protein KAU62_02365 [Candidatus Heimdallarchaeota archaeon]|nr:hypothetical protein [Candidatus Heimdallarchaeota archaeon]MCK4609979.1 hypothetical protein [Candidatus Heimdallarchaeota archaeon]
MKINFRKAKRAVSPVIATVLLISLVVAASAMVYFIVVPLLKGSASVNFITTQWFDSDGDIVADLVYITLQNTGSASATITNITLTIDNDVLDVRTVINNSHLVVEELPLTMDVTARADIAISFDPSSFVAVGNNVFRLMLTYADGTTSVAQENLNSIVRIDPLVMTVFNPINESWVKGIIDPQVIIAGGYKPSEVTYDFSLPDQTLILDDVPLATNIDSELYADDTGYKIIFSVEDSLNQSSEITNIFNIDNHAIGISLSLNASSIIQGEAIEASWIFTDTTGAPLINQTLVLSGDIYGSETLFTSITDAVTDYTISGAETNATAEDDFTFTLYVKDAVGNLNSAGESFNLVDVFGPTTYFISPANDTDGAEEILIEVYADDASGIDTSRFDIYFFSLSSAYYYLYQQSVSQEANYNIYEKKWVLEFNSFVLPDDNYTLVAQVYDSASNNNGNSAVLDLVEVDNDVTGIYGATATDGRGGFFFRRRGLLSFYVESLIPSTVLTIEKMKINWESSNRIDLMYTVYDDTFAQYWLDSAGGPYSEDTEYNVAPLQGGINITDAIDHHITIQFDYGDKPTTVTFTISLYIVSVAFTGWETYVIDTV